MNVSEELSVDNVNQPETNLIFQCSEA
jgi:hypothetical protein